MTTATQPAQPSRAAANPGLLTGLAYSAGCLVTDVFLLCVSFGAAAQVRAQFAHLGVRLRPLQALHFPEPASLYLLSLVVVVTGLAYEGMYRTGLAMLDRTERLVKSLSWSLFVIVLISFSVQRGASISRLSLFLSYVIALLLMVLLRPAWERWLVRTLHVHAGLSLLGDMELPADTRESLQSLGFDLFASSYGPPTRPQHCAALVEMGPGSQAPDLAEAEAGYLEVGVLPPAATLSALGSQPVNVRGAQIFVISHPLRRCVNRALKRMMDVMGAAGLLLCSVPAGLLIALLIRWDSPGPVLFGQRRLGRNGQPFVIWKFRTMVTDSEQQLAQVLRAHPEWETEYLKTGKLKQDPRVTRTGAWLRRYSLDELPQFWNVLIGDMSLVGPRPYCFAHERQLLGAAYAIIATVRPGLTGIWQTSGRSDTSYHSRRDFDVYYVRRWSLWLDLALLLKTLQAVLTPGAY